MKKLTALLLSIALLFPLLSACGGSDVTLKGVTSCERAGRVTAQFCCGAGTGNMYAFEFDMKDVRYIEGVDYPTGGTVTPNFDARAEQVAQTLYTEGEDAIISFDGYTLQLVEVTSEYALGYLSFIKSCSLPRDGAGQIDFGTMDIAFAKNGNKKYLPDNWEERLHAHEAVSQLDTLIEDADATMRTFFTFVEEKGLKTTLEDFYDPQNAKVGMLECAKSISADESEATFDRLCAYVWLLESGQLSIEESVETCLNAIGLYSRCADSAEFERLNKVFLSESGDDSLMSVSGGSYLLSMTKTGAMCEDGLCGVVAMLPENPMSYDTFPNPDEYETMMGGVLGCLVYTYADQFDAVTDYCIESSRFFDELAWSNAEDMTAEERFAFIERLSAAGITSDMYPKSSRKIVGSMLACSDFPDVFALIARLDGLGISRADCIGTSNYAQILPRETGAVDAARFDASGITEDITPPEGTVAVFSVDEGITMFYPGMYGTDTVMGYTRSLPVPESADGIDIAIVLVNRYEFYSSYTNGCTGYSCITDICAFDYRTGEALGKLCEVMSAPPASFFGEAGSSYYASPNLSVIHNTLLELYDAQK